MSQDVGQANSSHCQAAASHLIVWILVDEAVCSAEGTLKTSRRLFRLAQADGVIFTQNPALVDESQNQIHRRALVSSAGARLQNPNRLTNLLKSLVKISLAAKNVGRHPEERAEETLVTEGSGQVAGAAAKAKSIVEPPSQHELIGDIEISVENGRRF